MAQEDELVGARFTGHPFLDVGLAAMTIFVGKSDPQALTWADLDRVATYVEVQYIKPPLKGYLTMAFTSNAWFIQDGFNPDRPELTDEQREKRLQARTMWSSRHVRAWQTDSTSTERCVFTGLPAVAVALSGKLPDGRAGRAQAPLLQGDDSINFFAGGESGIPISGLALLALQYFPMGCAKAGMGLVAVHSENDRLTLRFARRFLDQTISGIAKAQAAGETKVPGAGRSLKTLLVETLVAIGEEQQREAARERAASVSAYEFNNGKTADLRLHHLPLQIVEFLRTVNAPAYGEAWAEVVRRAWQVPKTNGGKTAPSNESEWGARYNALYEDLFALPERAPRFIRTYFLRIPRRARSEGDPRATYSPQRELSLVSWPLVELFLGKVMLMEQARIEKIRVFGDRLADYTRKRNSKRFFRTFFTERNPNFLRDRLVKANLDAVKAGESPLFDMDSYIDVFEESEENYRSDWRLVRDLVLMRMIDNLKDWLIQNPEAVPAEELDPENASDERESAEQE
jgi:CRISPR-associated protein Cst1